MQCHQTRPVRWMIPLLLLAALAAAVLVGRGGAVQAQDEQPELRPGEIRNGELLAISIDSLVAPGRETRLVRRVGQEGEIWLPILDEQPLTAAGLTPGQLQAEIRRALMRKAVRVDIIGVARLDAGEDQQLILPLQEFPGLRNQDFQNR